MSAKARSGLYAVVASGAIALVACGGSANNAQGAAGSAPGPGVSTPGNGSTATGGSPASSMNGVSDGTGHSGGSSASTGNAGASAASAGASASSAGASSPTNGSAGAVASAGTGTDTAGASAAGASAAGAGGGAATERGDLGKGDGSDVITIGDSWMNILTNGGGIEGALDRAGTKYRHYAVAGTTLIGGDIPQQYVRAKQANPKIQTVIMTGGGNDIMFSNGCATKEACTAAVQMIADALDQLWSMMADDGVKDTIYIQYSKNAGTAPSDTRPDTAPIPKICTSGRIVCHAIDTTPYVGPGDTVDGIHPTLAACDKIAKATLDVLEQSGARR